MSKDHRYIWVSSEDKTRSRQTSLNEYRIELPSPLWLKGEWELALCDLTYHWKFTPLPTFISVCCDLVESNIIGGVEAQVLRRLLLGADTLTEYQFQYLQYIRIIHSYITTVQLTLVDEKGQPIEMNGWIYCTLHLRRRNSLLS